MVQRKNKTKSKYMYVGLKENAFMRKFRIFYYFFTLQEYFADMV